MTLLDVPEVSVRFGGVVALDGLSFSVDEGQICALIGPNGAGQDDVVQRRQPDLRADRGHGHASTATDLLALPPHRIAELGVTRTFQNLALFPGLSVLDNVMVGAHAASRGGFATCTAPAAAGAQRGAPRPRPRPWRSSSGSTSATSPTARAPACRTARSSASSSPGRSPPSPSC